MVPPVPARRVSLTWEVVSLFRRKKLYTHFILVAERHGLNVCVLNVNENLTSPETIGLH